MRVASLRINITSIRGLAKMLIFIILVGHLLVSFYYIAKWFYVMTKINLIMESRNIPRENRILGMANHERRCIFLIRRTVPEDKNILWNHALKISDFVNYYVYPRRIFQGEKRFFFKEDPKVVRDFLEKYNIEYFLYNFLDIRKIVNVGPRQ